MRSLRPSSALKRGSTHLKLAQANQRPLSSATAANPQRSLGASLGTFGGLNTRILNGKRARPKNMCRDMKKKPFFLFAFGLNRDNLDLTQTFPPSSGIGEPGVPPRYVSSEEQGEEKKQMPGLPSRFPLLGPGFREGVRSCSELRGRFWSCKETGRVFSTEKKRRYRAKVKSKLIKELMEQHDTYVASFGACVLLPVPSFIDALRGGVTSSLRSIPTKKRVFNTLIVLKVSRKSSKGTSPCVSDPRGNAWPILLFQHRETDWYLILLHKDPANNCVRI